MITFNKLTGYNGNGFCKDEHVFIENEGCFFETKEKAIAHYAKTATGNGVNHIMKEKKVDGVTVYNYYHTNVWN